MMNVCLLGASGSIGQQTLDVISKNPTDFTLSSFSVGNRTRCISYIIKKFKVVKAIYLLDKKKVKYYHKRFPSINFFSGEDGLLDLIDYGKPDMVVNALVGFVGLKPSIHTLKKNLVLALANKESLVVGGELINNILKLGKGKLYPIDSEHVALAKCLGVDNSNIEKLIITASGGSFRNLSRDQLTLVTPEDALKHPTWNMGKKITIDSATMINKTFEVIEAHYLFGYNLNHIDILMHDESQIHSLIKYTNGTYRLDKGKSDMRIPIKYALYEGKTSYKTYLVNDYHCFKDLHFHPFDIKRFPIVRYAKKVIDCKGGYGAVLNAANEECVYAFLRNEISFLDIEDIISILMDSFKNIKHPSLEEIIEIDKKTRQKALNLIKERRK